jgi:hypothetical protein
MKESVLFCVSLIRESATKAALTAKAERQKIEEQRAVVLGFERHQTAARAGFGHFVQRLQVRRLPAQRGTVVDELDRKLTIHEIELHG